MYWFIFDLGIFTPYYKRTICLIIEYEIVAASGNGTKQWLQSPFEDCELLGNDSGFESRRRGHPRGNRENARQDELNQKRIKIDSFSIN